MGKRHVQLRATTGITKNKEFIDLRKIICSRKSVPLTFQNQQWYAEHGMRFIPLQK